ncbi:GDP-6-deoxy-D-mannose reductase [Hartmannibacter diazotrophicus]|uniref:GDP-6-deoxy-D-mannose reductase n=1 Tax=Hartmannibacter diazotrophicus TaxID=1482074 RepID=A0A2C9D2D8_9HYPH|nr:NAD(P)-dependent oxidoreductase [Hartmannibacter diazotrophicus]SON54424.1 GDP-6-deoxy-D-mannose reductase [Hartmannibacter diazotrophicus]
MTRIVVTGGRGLIGRHAVDRLIAAGADVHLVGRRAPQMPTTSPVRFHAVDLLDGAATSRLMEDVRPSHLLHLAWETGHGHFWSAPENLDWLAATLHLMRAFNACGGRRFVGAGTCAEYDWNDAALATGACHETLTPTRPGTLYGIAKDACHRVLQSFAQTSGFEAAWGRVFLLFGPEEDDRRFVKSIIMSLAADRRASCTAGTQVRDFLSSRDVGAAFAALALSDVSGPVNIGSGEPRSLAEVATTIGDLMGKPDLIGLGDNPTRPGDPPRLVADVTRLATEVGFEPAADLRTRLSQCIAELVPAGTRLSSQG